MAPIATNLKPMEEHEPKPVDEIKIIKELQKSLKAVTPTQAANMLSGEKTRPKGWSGLTNAPYYRERYALELKMVIDAMREEFREGIFEDREYKYVDFCNDQPGSLTRKSLYLKINQSKRYLLDELDFDGAYRAFFELLAITKENTGIRISYNRDVRVKAGEQPFMLPSKVTPKEESFAYKEKIDKFLEEAKPGEVLAVKKLSLTEEDITDIQASLCQLQDIAYTVTPSMIRIVKLRPEDIEHL